AGSAIRLRRAPGPEQHGRTAHPGYRSRRTAGSLHARNRQPGQPGATAASVVFAGCVGGPDRASEGEADGVAAGGSAKSHGSAERTGFRGPVLGNRTGGSAQCGAAAAGGVVAMTAKFLYPLVALMGAVYAFQMPFREYPGMEYNNFPKPADWDEKTE